MPAEGIDTRGCALGRSKVLRNKAGREAWKASIGVRKSNQTASARAEDERDVLDAVGVLMAAGREWTSTVAAILSLGARDVRAMMLGRRDRLANSRHPAGYADGDAR